MSDARAFKSLDVGARTLEILEHDKNVSRHSFAGGCQFDSARETFEQWRAYFRLEIQYLTVDGGGCDIQPSRGFTDGTGAANRIEIDQRGGVNTQFFRPDPLRLLRKPETLDRISARSGNHGCHVTNFFSRISME